MDIAYDHIQEEALTPEQAAQKSRDAEATRQSDLNAELKDTYKTFAASSWGKSLGGFLSDVKKQSETFYDEARQEAGVMQGEALRGFTGLKESLVGHARSMSSGGAEGEAVPAASSTGEGSDEKTRTQSEAQRDNDDLLSKFRAEAAKALREVEKVEEATDAAIFKYGAKLGNFFKDAVSVAPPGTAEEQRKGGKVLFESRDVDGKRVIHSTRFEAQLHAVHSSLDSFIKDPESAEYQKWKDDFDIEKKTDAIAKDLEKYPELRSAMEKLVPEKVEYPAFWTRYYFLRMVVETEEERRREILKGATNTSNDETLAAWDDDSDDDEKSSTPQQQATIKMDDNTATTPESSTTLNPRDSTPTASSLKPFETRRSEDGKSQADSDASYDLVSGASSRAPGSPREGRGKKEDDDEEEDWE